MKYEVSLSNDSCIFDSETGFGTIAEAIEWGLGRGHRYVLHVGAQDGNTVSFGVVGDRLTINVGSPWERTFSAKQSLDKIVDIVLCDIVSHIGEYGMGPDWDEVTVKAVSYYTSDAADEEDSVDLGGRRIIKKKKKKSSRASHDWHALHVEKHNFN